MTMKDMQRLEWMEIMMVVSRLGKRYEQRNNSVFFSLHLTISNDADNITHVDRTVFANIGVI